jgi:type I restriction enzyme R subunit
LRCDQKELLKEQYNKVLSYFEGLTAKDIDKAVEILMPEDVREQFEYDFKQFSKTMDAVLPDPVINQYRENLSFLANIRAQARTAYFDENLNLEGYGEKIKQLIEESIVASNTIKLIPPTKIDNKNFMKLVNSYGSNQTRASIIESKIRKVIEENEEKNPEFCRTLKERLERLIAKQHDEKITDANEFMKLQALLEELFAEEEKSKALGFNVRVQFAIFGILEKVLKDFEPAKKITFDIYYVLQPLKVIDWRQKENNLKKMRVTVKDILTKNNIHKD